MFLYFFLTLCQAGMPNVLEEKRIQGRRKRRNLIKTKIKRRNK